MSSHLQRFVDAQQGVFETALSELKGGRKRSHWMWYLFPQIAGLGLSTTSKMYAIEDIQEAKDFLAHPVLGHRLIVLCETLLRLNENNATTILGSPDDMKLKSSMTLFSIAAPGEVVFQQVLGKFFHNAKDKKTVDLLRQ